MGKKTGILKTTLTTTLIAVLAILVLGTTNVSAYDSWTGGTGPGCDDCHGAFNAPATDYTSLHDGTVWGENLMYGHYNVMNLDCLDCHTTKNDSNFKLNTASFYSCVDCHGRYDDSTGTTGGWNGSLGIGDGLRAHHAQAGVNACASCHTQDTTPIGEDRRPFAYMFSKKDVDSCFDPAFGPDGLDNDGDGLYDLNDPDCDYVPDADGDKIPDYVDPDDDNDGVLDVNDLCPNTPSGVEVDANGCTIPPITYLNNSITTTANQSTTVNATAVNVTLDIYTSQAVNGSVNMTLTSVNQSGTKALGVPALGRYLQINASLEIEGNLTWAMLSIYYSDEEVASAGLVEEYLAMYWWNESSSEWVELNDSLDWVFGAGVNTSLNYVWANFSHFSNYALGVPQLPVWANLSQDWNMFGVPVGIANYSLPTALSSISGSYDWVFYFNASTDTWQYYNPSMPQFSDLTELEPGRGYFIQMTGNATLNFTGTILSDLSVPLLVDWNMFAPPMGMTNYTLPAPLTSIAGSYDWVFYFNATTDAWQYYNPSMPQFSDLTELEAGRGYFIQMTQNDTFGW